MTENKRSAKSASPKGRPSGSGREGSGLKETNDVDREEENRIADKYTDDTENQEPTITERHHNRNTDKGREDQGKDPSSS
jgi:hypothetical protein